MSRAQISLLAFAFAVAVSAGLDAADRQVVFDQPMAAGISGLRPFWNRPVVLTADGASREAARGNVLKGTMAIWGKELEWHDGHQRWMEVVDPKYKPKPEDRSPGLITFDAVHRSLLLRFPGLAQRLAEELGKGGSIAKVELVLPYRGTERMSQGYQSPSSFIGDHWDTQEPRWHAVAWRLRRAWNADPEKGPTFNGPVNGVVSWAKYGAQDERQDRFAQQLGPAEISHKASEAIDLTATLTDAAYGATLGERLRGLDDCGVLVRKLEYYDAAFETPGYEWGMMTGGRGILIQAPKLVVTLADGKPAPVALPPAAEPAKGAWAPTAVLPDADAFAKLAERYAFRQPAGMPDWQWQRVQELNALGGNANLFPKERREYLSWIDDILRMPPRTWQGFDAANQLALYYTFREAFPAPVIDHLKLYWTAWLMPHMDTRDMVHNQYHQIWTEFRGKGSAYLDRTGDWRGNKSFYREAYTRLMSTMNFNNTATLGALLGGTLIGSERAIADGRFGLEMFPVRLWSWYDGTTQESIDHYYFSHTLTAQKMVADHGPTLYDRMLGESCLVKSIEELAVCYHPQLKRFVSTGGRTGINYALAINEGVGFIMHALSRKGALTDLGVKEVGVRVPTVGHDFPPRRVAAQALDGPWGPAWAPDLIDDKQLPFEMTATFKQWGAFRDPPKWKKSWLGRHYGVASHDCTMGTLQQMAVWNRKAEPATGAEDIGLFTVRFGFNRTNMLDSFHYNAKNDRANPNGVLGEQGGHTACLQHRGTMVILSSPYPGLKSSADLKPESEPITSIQTTAMLSTVQAVPTWEVYADGKRVEALPATLPASARITVKDGVSHLALIPIPATALGARDAEILIHAGGPPVRMQGGGEMSEKLLIENLHYRSDKPYDVKGADQAALDAASGGFVVIASDASEGDFAAFQKRIAAGTLADAWDAASLTRSIRWSDGADVLDLGFRPQQGGTPDGQLDAAQYFPWRKVNGAWPYLAPGMERDTTVSCMGRTGRLEKNGATLMHEPGMMGYLLANAGKSTYMFANPLPDLAWQRFAGPAGLAVEMDGKVGILTVDIDAVNRRVEVKHAVAPGVAGEGIATALLLRGLAPAEVVVNRKRLGRLATVDAEAPWTVIPLGDGPVDTKAVLARWQAARAQADAAFAATAAGEQPVMAYEPKQEHYLLTRPRPGAVRFHRQWHSGTAFVASVPGGPTVTADGRVALRSLLIDTATGTVDIDAPQYYQEATGNGVKFEGKASAFLILVEQEPRLVFNDRPAKPVRSLQIDGRTAWVLPLPGGAALRDDAGIVAGAAEAQRLASKR